jgi:hypothetical protein
MQEGNNHVFTWNREVNIKSRFRKFLKTGKNRNNKIKARSRLIKPVITASVVNSEIISLPEAPLIILIPIPLILLPVIDE